MLKALLCIPADYDYNFPPLGTPALCAFLRKNSIDCSQIDLNLKYRDFLASRIYANVISLKEQRFFLKPVLKSFFKEKLKGRYYSDFLPRDSDGTQLFLPYDNNTNSSFYFTERLLSSECLFRYLEDEEENTFLQFYRDTNFLGVLKKKGIKLLGISIISPSQAVAGLTLGLLVKKRLPYIHVNIGGQWLTLYRKAILQKKQLFRCFDSVTVFEGETPFFRLVEAVERKTGYSSITNILTKDSLVDICLKPEGEDLNNLPCPDFDGLALEDYDGFQDNGQAALTYETSRGCYWSKCAYCVDLPLPKPSYRRKQPDLVAKDIKELREKYNAGYLLLGDPGVSARQMLEVSKSILNEGVKIDWWCMARLDPGFSRNIFDIAYRAGLKKINFGFESASGRACRLLDKGNQRARSARIIKDCAESGIQVDLQTMLGLPQETFEEGLETVNFLLENKEFISHVSFNIYYLTPANFVYLEPEKYGISYKKNDSLPFRFFIPFTNNAGMDKFEAYHLQEIYYTLLSKDRPAECDAEFAFGQRLSLQSGVYAGQIEFNLNRETHKMHYLHKKEPDEYLFMENTDKTAVDALINGSYKIIPGAGIPARLSDLIREGLKKRLLDKEGMSEKVDKLSLLVIFLFLFLPLQAIAQDLSPGEQPGAQGSRFQAESVQNKKGVEKKKAKVSQIEIEKEKGKPSPEVDISFILTNVKITGSTIFKPEDFRPAYKTYIGKQVTFKDLKEIVTGIKAQYKKKGYLSTDVYIPEQDIIQGEAEIRVSEGKLGEVKLEGNKWFSSSLLEKSIHTKKNEILNIFKLQKDMLRLNQNPDLDVIAVLSPGKESASIDIVLKVKESCPYHAGFNFDNQGVRLVGKDRRSLALRSTNFSGGNDSIAVNILKSKTSSGEFFSYAMPLGTYGTKIGFDFTNFYMKLGKEYKDSDITGTTQIYTPHVSSEMYLSQDFQAYADLGIDIKSIKKKNGRDTVTNDQIRLPYAAFDFTKTDYFFGGGQTSFLPRFSFSSTGHYLGASSRGHPLASRPGTGGFFFKYEQVLKRIQRAPFDSFISVRSQFQAASHTLPSSEQLQMGGANSVRGYPEGEYLADTGVIVNAEWVFPSYIFPKEYKLPNAKMALRDQFQPVIFMDLGEGKLKKIGSGETHRGSLMGAGAGIRFQFNRNFFLRMDWAKHLGDRPTSGQGPSNFYITCQIEI